MKYSHLVLLCFLVTVADLARAEIVELSNDQTAFEAYCGDNKIFPSSFTDRSVEPARIYPIGPSFWRLKFYRPSAANFVTYSSADLLADCSWSVRRIGELLPGGPGQPPPQSSVPPVSPPGREGLLLNLHWEELRDPGSGLTLDIAVDVYVYVDDIRPVTSPRPQFSIRVDNRIADPASDMVLFQVDFPALELQRIPGATGEVLVVPYSSGMLIRDPIGSLQSPLRMDYGEGHSMQFAAYYDPAAQAGLYIACRDPYPYIKNFTVQRASSAAVLYAVGTLTWTMKDAWSGPDEWNYGNDYRPAPDYWAEAGPFIGDWFDAAMIYRSWAIRQAWCWKGPVRQRNNPLLPDTFIPDWLRLRNRITLYVSPQIEDTEFDPDLYAGYLPRWHQDMEQQDVIVSIWPWWWDPELFRSMSQTPWIPGRPPRYYYMNMPEYTGGGDYVEDNDPPKFRPGFREMTARLTTLTEPRVHYALTPYGFTWGLFGPYQYDWSPYISYRIGPGNQGFFCSRDRNFIEAMSDVVGDMFDYNNAAVTGLYWGFGYFHSPCHSANHTHVDDGEVGGGRTFLERSAEFRAAFQDKTVGAPFWLMSEGPSELACALADIISADYFPGDPLALRRFMDSMSKGNMEEIPLFSTVYHDYVIGTSMMYFQSGTHWHNEYLDGSYVTPSRESDCQGVTFDFYVFDPETNSYPSYDMKLAAAFQRGYRYNISEMDMGADEFGNPLDHQRFVERDPEDPDGPFAKSRAYLAKLLAAYEIWGADEEDRGARYIDWGEAKRPPDVRDPAGEPAPWTTPVAFDAFFYDYCLLMHPTAGPVVRYAAADILSAAWHDPGSGATVLALTNWTSAPHQYQLRFSPEDYGFPPGTPFRVARMTELGFDPEQSWSFPGLGGAAIIDGLELGARDVALYQVRAAQPVGSVSLPLQQTIGAQK